MEPAFSPNSMRIALLVAIVATAALCDLRTRRIPNALTLGGALAGVLLAACGFEGGPSFAASAAGGALGLALLLPLYTVRALGAGDAKLMAAVGAFVGAPAMVFVFLFTGVAGGIAALARLDLVAMPTPGRIPYGICICAGTLAWLVLSQWH